MAGNFEPEWDVFICHASEDKDLVKPLATSLNRLKVDVWYDEFELELGDSISKAIDRGLAKARYGLVVISHDFIGKGWPDYELRGLISREIGGEKVILPIWRDVSRDDVAAFSPSLADKLAFKSHEMSAEDMVIGILKVVRPDIYEKQPRAQLEKLAKGGALRELQEELEHTKERMDVCPVCGSELTEKSQRTVAMYGDYGEVEDLGDFMSYACGYSELDGVLQYPCSKDPDFPTLDHYDLETEYEEQHSEWMCYARPKTEMAKLVHLRSQPGKTEEQARQRLIESSRS